LSKLLILVMGKWEIQIKILENQTTNKNYYFQQTREIQIKIWENQTKNRRNPNKKSVKTKQKNN
jgi:hypothetical protein